MAYLYALNPADPVGTDPAKLGWQHIQNLEAAVKERINSFFANVDNDPLQGKDGARFLGAVQIDGNLRFGGSGATEPMLKRVDATIQARIANDADFASIAVRSISAQGVTSDFLSAVIGTDPGGTPILRVGGASIFAGAVYVESNDPVLYFRDKNGPLDQKQIGFKYVSDLIEVNAYTDAEAFIRTIFKIHHSGLLGATGLYVGTDPGGAELLRVGGAAKVGSLNIGGGTTISKVLLASVSWDPGLLDTGNDVGSVQEDTFTVTGAAVGDLVYATNPWGGKITVSAEVTAANTVTLTANNTDSDSVMGTGLQTVKIIVVQF